MRAVLPLLALAVGAAGFGVGLLSAGGPAAALGEPGAPAPLLQVPGAGGASAPTPAAPEPAPAASSDLHAVLIEIRDELRRLRSEGSATVPVVGGGVAPATERSRSDAREQAARLARAAAAIQPGAPLPEEAIRLGEAILLGHEVARQRLYIITEMADTRELLTRERSPDEVLDPESRREYETELLRYGTALEDLDRVRSAGELFAWYQRHDEDLDILYPEMGR